MSEDKLRQIKRVRLCKILQMKFVLITKAKRRIQRTCLRRLGAGGVRLGDGYCGAEVYVLNGVE